MIDRDVIERDLRQNISDWPVTLIYKGRTIQAALQSQADLSTIMSSGLLEDSTITIVAVRSDFGKRLPEDRELLDLKLKDRTIQSFEISNIPDRYDTMSPMLTLIVGSPDK